MTAAGARDGAPPPAGSAGAGAAPASASAAPVIAAPKGGGAIRGLGETFEVGAATGTGGLTIPLGLTPGRGGFGPALGLSYDSGHGNGPFGLGWSLGLAAIARKTDKGVPRYRDAEESDVFVLSGAEDLVPVLEPDGRRHRDTTSAPGYAIERYRPRTEGAFARIERWTHATTGDVHWRSISRDNVTSVYGATDASRIADGSRIFSWLLCETRDDKGNAVRYDYAADADDAVDRSPAHERNRTRTAGRYLKRVRYGNVRSCLVEPDLDAATWLFEAVLDYGEGHVEWRADGGGVLRASPDPATPPAPRPDPFSSYRSGFEVRTYRRCLRVLMFHRFDSLGPEPCLVGALELDYDDLDYTRPVDTTTELTHPGSTRSASCLRRATRWGFVRDDPAQPGYAAQSLPALELDYSRAVLDDAVHEPPPGSLANLPEGVDGTLNRWVDLDGEGIPGVLTEQAGGWFYKRNLGAGRLGPLESVPNRPTTGGTVGGRAQLLDLAGDGGLDVVSLDPGLPGFYARGDAGDWVPFAPIAQLPNLDWGDPNLRFVDLTGDGRADLLMTGDGALHWHPSRGVDGFGARERVPLPADEEHGPRVMLADPTAAVHLADMSGDGGADLVRIRNGEVSWWPGLGHGAFGPRVAMDDAPWFDAPELFDGRRLRLIDVDGSGTTDVVYLGRDGVDVYLNQAGNRLGGPRTLRAPASDGAKSVEAVDLLGTGTGCLVWSSPLPGDAGAPLRYVDLTGGVKPHLLVGMRNNLGAETTVEYAPSTRFALADAEQGRPWATRLPFPVHVVARVVTRDLVTGGRLVTSYSYHHGFYDRGEREFRGFARVDQVDAETVGGGGGGGGGGGPGAAAWAAAPVRTRTWFHTGAWLGGAPFRAGLRGEYAAGDALGELDDALPAAPEGESPLSTAELREATRALKGAVLRREIAVLAGGEPGVPAAAPPLVVSESSYAVMLVQRRAADRHAVFLVHPRETLDARFERGAGEPRVSHALTLAVDRFGNTERSVAIAYGRREGDPDPLLTPADRARQARPLVTETLSTYTNAVERPREHRTPLPCEQRRLEIVELAAPQRDRYGFDELLQRLDAAPRRLLHHTRDRYRRDDLDGLLPFGELEPCAIPGERHQLVLTDELVAGAWRREEEPLLGPDPAALLAGEAGYVRLDGHDGWWAPAGRIGFHADRDASAADELAAGREHFFLPRRFEDAFGSDTLVAYDARDLLPVRTQDPLGNATRAEYDERVLQPRLVADPNGNETACRYDALGLPAATAIMGKPGDRLGDTLDGSAVAEPSVQAFAADPLGHAPALLGAATTRLVYEVHRFARCGQPPFVATLARETHGAAATAVHVSLSYSDGFGRELQSKARAADGDAPRRRPQQVGPTGDAAPGPLLLADGAPVHGPAAPRWVGTGRTVYDNKGRAVLRHEPFFSATHHYEDERDLTDTGAPAIVFHDPLDRAVATLRADHAYEKAVFEPWRRAAWDANDTVALDPRTDPDVADLVRGYFATQPAGWATWLAQRTVGGASAADVDAADKAVAHAGTPARSFLDPLGRAFLVVADNAAQGDYATRSELDADGRTLRVVDARGVTVVERAFDLLGAAVRTASPDAGERWALHDAGGQLVRGWSTRRIDRRIVYDALRRPLELHVRDGAGAGERLAQRTVYGEAQGAAANHRGRVFEVHDGAGVVRNETYDAKGNLLRTSRRLRSDHAAPADWRAPQLEQETFAGATTYDALDRPVQIVAPHAAAAKVHVLRPGYDVGGLLTRVDAWLERDAEPAGLLDRATASHAIVAAVDYDALGRERRVLDGNGVVTTRSYDPLTQRLARLLTRRGKESLQDLAYTYDPVGNVTRIRDDAHERVFHSNACVTPGADYRYDATYRLEAASGREHRAGGGQDGPDDPPAEALPNDCQALQAYVERYAYDAVGNILSVAHHRGGTTAQPGPVLWNRRHSYGGDANRLLATSLPGEDAGFGARYDHDAHGNLTAMPHLTALAWDEEDRLARVDRGGGGRTHHLYDGAGERVRKICEKQPGLVEERIYLGVVEIFRRRTAAGVTLERETLHVPGPGGRVALVELRTVGTDRAPRTVVRHQYEDHLGSCALELDEQARLLSYEEYRPYGSTAYRAATGAAGRAKRYRFGGKERDDDSGFSYHGARFYVPFLGRWASCDPAGLADGTNVYCFVRCNPVRLTDPSGRQSHPSPDQIGDIYRSVDDVPKYFDQECKPSASTALEQQRRVAQGEGKRAQQQKEAAAPKKPIAQKRQEDWDAAKAAIWNTALDMATAGPPGLGPPSWLIDAMRAQRPTAADDPARDAELQENYEQGELVAQIAGAAISLLPIGEALEAASVASKKLPASAGMGSLGGGEWISFSRQWAAEGNALASPRMSDRAIAQQHLYDVNADNVLREVPGIRSQWRTALGNLNQGRLVESLESTPVARDAWEGIRQAPGQSVPDLRHIGPANGTLPYGEITTMNPATVEAHRARWYWSQSEALLYPNAPTGWNIWRDAGRLREYVARAERLGLYLR